MRKQLWIGWLIISIVFCLAGCKSDNGEAKATRQVVLYCSADQEFAEKIVKRFEEKTGIKVLTRYDVEATKTLGLVQRLRSESANPQADVFWSSEIFETIGLAKEGIFTEYSGEMAKAWPAEYRDAGGRWFGFALRARVIGVNTKRVKPEEIPTSIEDLLEPRWKGRLVMARPQFGTTRGHVAAMWTHYGPEKAEAIFRGLAANEVKLASGNSSAVRMVAEGRADVCLTDTDDVWVAKRNGWPVEIAYPKHGEAGTLMIPNTVAMVKGAKHAAEAEALIDFLLSAEVEEMLAESDSHNVPIRPTLAKKFLQYEVPSPMVIDYEKVSAAIGPAMRAVGSIIK
jgi:iron(III) transport system substrate-binding protein